MTDDEIVLWLITKATMEDKPVMRLAADRIIQMAQALREHDDLVECNEQFSVDNQFLKKRVEETRREWEGWQSAAFKLMEKVTALTVERDRLREALEYILAECTLSDNTVPSVGAIKYAALAALKGETP